MSRLLARSLYVASLTFTLITLSACGDDAAGGGSSGGDTNTPANAIDASVEGGSDEGPVKGASETSVPNQFYGTVADGTLSVYLASEQGQVVFFTLDTSQSALPGSVPVTQALDEVGYLTLTRGISIAEGTGGSVKVDACPNTQGAAVSGSFQGVTLIDTASGADAGTLSGSFEVIIVLSDGSANCTTTGGGDNNGAGDAPSPGPQCPNDVCDGPCCPYVPALTACQLGCFNEFCTSPSGFFECASCLEGCPEEVGMTDDAACWSAYTALGECAERNACEPGAVDDDACVAANCCEPYKAAF